jgi:hypothetical protein
MKRLLPTLFALALAAAAAVLLLSGCGGDDPAGPTPEPGPELRPTVRLVGEVALPEGWTGDPAGVSVVNGLATAGCDAAGVFSLKTHADHDQFALALGASGEPLLLGWFGAGRTQLSARTTAETLVWFALGAWMLPDSLGNEVRGILADPATDLAGLEAAWTAAVTAQPGGVAGENVAVHDALQAAVTALLADPGKGVIIEPGAQQSGIDVLNEGGINKLTIMNSYRRRAVGFLWRESWEDTLDVEHEYDDEEPFLQVEIPPTDAFGGTLNTILGYITGNSAYVPTAMDPIQLDHHDGAVQTNYRLNVLGIGLLEPDDLSLYSSWELEQGEWMAMKCLVLDYFLPMVLNIAGAAGTVAGEVFNDDIPGQVNDFIAFVGNELPNFYTEMNNGDWQGALLELWNAALTNGTMQGWVRDTIEDLLQSARFTADETATVMGPVNRLFAVIGIVDIIGNLFDNITFGYHVGECKTAESWEIAVTTPRVHIEPREKEMMAFGSQMLELIADDDTGGNPEGWSYAYHWTCTGRHGTMYNPRNMNDSGNDFFTSSEFVQYVAEHGSEGEEDFTCELYYQLGTEQTLINDATAKLYVIRQHIALPDTQFTCPRGTVVMLPTLVPPYEGTGTVLWTWSGGGVNGTLRGSGNESPPWTSESNQASFLVDSDGGDDHVTCVASIRYENEVVSPVDTVNVLIKDMSSFEPYAGQHVCHPQFDVVDGGCYCGFFIAVHFREMPGVQRYRIHGTGFNDPLYYGTVYDHTIQTQYLLRDENGLYVKLTWGYGNCDCANPPDSCSAMWRFAGATWEISPVCP